MWTIWDGGWTVVEEPYIKDEREASKFDMLYHSPPPWIFWLPEVLANAPYVLDWYGLTIVFPPVIFGNPAEIWMPVFLPGCRNLFVML